ncbi:MAG: efflux RND transporter periplasmic adaptor subunit [Chitinophagaceae bacterium]|nr:efflux RND transporter periplasmic adaptor subunit [Chitinophagaceae bacterium]
MGKFLVIAFFLLSITVVSSSCKSDGKDEKKPGGAGANRPPAKVDAFVVTPKILSRDIVLPGSLMAAEETELHTEVSGRVTGIYFNEGSNVSQGSTLVKLYDGDLQAQLNKLKVQLKVAQETQLRYEALLKINGVSQQEYELYKLSVNNIQADMAIVQANISRTLLRAPFSGRLGLRNISMGAYITPATTISTIRKVSQLKLEFTVPEKYGSGMKPGGLVQFSMENNPANYKARIIATENNIAEETRSLRVRALVDKPDARLIAGGFVKVKIELGQDDAALMIPSQAVIPKARNKEVIVYRGGLAAMAVVTTGLRDSSLVEITSGLKAGDTVLVTGLLTTKPGSKVLLNNVIKP